MTDEAYRDFAKDGTDAVLQTSAGRRRLADVRAVALLSSRVDRRDARCTRSLGARLDTIEHERSLPGNRIYYLAVPPTMFAPAVQQPGGARGSSARPIRRRSRG